jgi:23S rRNA (cytosine1962-C5)-methyltransferase
MQTDHYVHFKQFPGFELLDSGDGYRLERWGDFILSRPDPQIIWKKSLPETEWQKADATFEQFGEEGGRWIKHNKLPETWLIDFTDAKLVARLTPFKHTGIFAEQAANWEWSLENLKFKEKNLKLRILNLFAYTGAASVILAKAGCFVTHVDASKPAIGWAKENQKANKLPEDSIRWILDDVQKFVSREIKRGQKYDGIIMDPPAFGHSPSGKTWKFNRDLPQLLSDCVQLLSDEARFILVNGYATNSSAIALQNIMEDTIKRPGSITSGELALKQKNGRLLSTGILARWESK